MKAYFINLFNYDRYANLLIFDAMANAGNVNKAQILMNHLLVAQQVWFARCAGLPPVKGTLWSEDIKPPEVTFEMIDDNHKAWINYLETLVDTDFEKTIAYTNIAGTQHYTNTLAEICTHVINHGTHHRAQIGQHLKASGAETLPNTDYIGFVR